LRIKGGRLQIVGRGGEGKEEESILVIPPTNIMLLHLVEIKNING